MDSTALTKSDLQKESTTTTTTTPKTDLNTNLISEQTPTNLDKRNSPCLTKIVANLHFIYFFKKLINIIFKSYDSNNFVN